MKRIFAFIPFSLLLVACGGGDEAVSLCNCEPDEYCVDDVCHPTDSSVAPAPGEK